MLITRGFGVGTGPGEPGETIYVPICGTDMDITGASSSRVKSKEALTKLKASSTQTSPIISTEVEDTKTTIDITQLKPTIKPKE